MQSALQRLLGWFSLKRFFPTRSQNVCGDAWWVETERVDSAAFFRMLPERLPEATTLYVEGTSIAPDVLECYERHTEAGAFLAERGTISPRSRKLRCRFSPELCAELAALADVHAEPALLDHLHVFAGSEFLLCWHDAFFNGFLLSPRVPEERVAAFAGTLGATYAR